MDKSSKTEYDFGKLIYKVIIFVAIVFTIAMGFYIYKFHMLDIGKPSDFGSFGDFVGGLMNPMLQFIVISMLFWSIQVQRQELHATRNTLESTKDELTETKKANVEQARELKKQADELKEQTDLLKEQRDDNRDKISVEQQLMYLNDIEKGIEYLFEQKLYIVSDKEKYNNIETTFGYLIFAPHRIEADAFRYACLQKNTVKAGVEMIIRVVNQRFAAYVASLSDGVSSNVLSYPVISYRLGWVMNMGYSFNILNIINENPLSDLINRFNNAVNDSSFNEQEKRLLIESLNSLKG